MVLENPSQNQIGTLKDRHPGFLWVLGWTLLVTAAIPVAWIMAPPVTVTGMWLSKLGMSAGFWAAPPGSVREGPGLLLSLALALAVFQWLMLHRWLPRAWQWSLATLFSMLLGGIITSILFAFFHIQWTSKWILVVPLLTVGLILGLAHWLYLRRFLSHAAWIILIDVLAAGSLLLLGNPVTNLAGLLVFIFPGAISGLGMWILLKQPHVQNESQIKVRVGSHARWILIGLEILALIPLFFGCLWIYATSQLTLAKNNGVYPTAKDAVIASNSKGWGGAHVTSIDNIHTGPNSFDGSHPHIWFGTATVHYDRIPQGGRHDWDLAGSYYIHVQDGWVWVSEGAFPELIGWIMELYHLEGVGE
jgi:hypothetical protein